MKSPFFLISIMAVMIHRTNQNRKIASVVGVFRHYKLGVLLAGVEMLQLVWKTVLFFLTTQK